MGDDRNDRDRLTGLHGRVGGTLSEGPTDLDRLSPEEMQDLVHELRRTQQELEASRDVYADLYDSAPAGYLTLSQHRCRTILTDISEWTGEEEKQKTERERLEQLLAGRNTGLEEANKRLHDTTPERAQTI